MTAPHEGRPIYTSGTPIEQASSAMILVHGRGATAEGILELGSAMPVDGMVYIAPQAAGNTWYPYSFLAPIAQNEPGLSSALDVLAQIVGQLEAQGIPAERTVLAGFSQGACLVSEFAARHARRYGGLLAFSGGLIGPPGTPRDYAGSLSGTPVFLGCSDVDPHIPLPRVQETAEVLGKLDADVELIIYPGMAHTIIEDEIQRANALLNKALANNSADETL